MHKMVEMVGVEPTSEHTFTSVSTSLVTDYFLESSSLQWQSNDGSSLLYITETRHLLQRSLL